MGQLELARARHSQRLTLTFTCGATQAGGVPSAKVADAQQDNPGVRRGEPSRRAGSSTCSGQPWRARGRLRCSGLTSPVTGTTLAGARATSSPAWSHSDGANNPGGRGGDPF